MDANYWFNNEMKGRFLSWIKDCIQNENFVFEKAIRENAVPKIKGDITVGKLRWRGIRIVQRNEFMKTYKWVEQRGYIISPKISTATIIENKSVYYKCT
jgi:hypothetical protein